MSDTPQHEVLNITLSAVADTEIVFNNPVVAVMIKNRVLQDIQFRSAEGDSAYWLVLAGSSFSMDFQGYAAKKAGWLRAAAGTGPAEVLGLRVGV